MQLQQIILVSTCARTFFDDFSGRIFGEVALENECILTKKTIIVLEEEYYNRFKGRIYLLYLCSFFSVRLRRIICFE